jgi:hypothetical protein
LKPGNQTGENLSFKIITFEKIFRKSMRVVAGKIPAFPSNRFSFFDTALKADNAVRLKNIATKRCYMLYFVGCRIVT